MSRTTKTSASYPFSYFVASSGKVNSAILAAEVTTANPSVPLDSVSLSGTTALITLSGLGVSADLTLIDGVVAAHLGSDFQAVFQRASDESETTNDTVNDVTKTTLSTGPLPAGTYAVTRYAEVAASSAVASTGASVGFNVAKNGDSATELGRSANDLTTYTSFSGAYSAPILSGESLVMTLVFKRLGVSSNPAKVRRARIFLSPQGA